MESKIVDLIFSFTVKPQNQARYEQTLARQLAITQNEPGLLSYEVFRRGDGTFCQHERYADEAAIRLHMQHTAEPLSEWYQLTQITHITALGPLSDEFKQEFAMTNYLPYAAITR